MSEAVGADIEIVERASDGGDGRVVVPNTVRINGTEFLIPADSVIQVGDISSHDMVTVNVTLICRSLSVRAEADQPTVRTFSGKTVNITDRAS